MIRLKLQVDLAYTVGDGGADFVFYIHAAHTAHQTLQDEQLTLNQGVEARVSTEPVTGNRCLRLHAAPGPLNLSYAVTVDILHHAADPDRVTEVPVRYLPDDVMHYIYPSRYCQSDRLGALAMREFGHLPQGYARVQAICQWVRSRVKFMSNVSTSTTAAVDTLVDGVGVCRDFAHLMIALCRALSIPARFATGTDYGADPALGPPDFHAYVEVYLGDRWYLFDPSGTAIPMGMMRFATGRDAADVAFATIFGSVQTQAPVIRAWAVQDPARHLMLPCHSPLALSTDGPTPPQALRHAP